MQDIAPDARETKVHYSPSEKDGVFVVESARGADTSGAPKLHSLSREQQLPLQSSASKIQKNVIIERDEKIDFNEEKLNFTDTALSMRQTLESNNEEVLVHPPPNGVSAEDEVHTVEEEDVVIPPPSLPKLENHPISKKAISGSTNTGLSQSDLSVSSSGSNQGYRYGTQEPYTVDPKGYQSSSPHQNNLENPPLEESDDNDNIDVVRDYVNDSKPIITAAIFKEQINDPEVQLVIDIDVLPNKNYNNNKNVISLGDVDIDFTINENIEQVLNEDQNVSIKPPVEYQEQEDDELVEQEIDVKEEEGIEIETEQQMEQEEYETDGQIIVEEPELEQNVVEEVEVEQSKVELKKDDEEPENVEIEEIKEEPVPEQKSPVQQQNEEPEEIVIAEQTMYEKETTQDGFDTGGDGGERNEIVDDDEDEDDDDEEDEEEDADTEKENSFEQYTYIVEKVVTEKTILTETNGKHLNGENENTNATETGNEFDSLTNLPAPPTSDEIKQLNDTSENMDSLPPPPPPEVSAGAGPINGES